MKEFVKESCSKRIKLMVNGVEPINPDLHAQWTHITGHTIKLYWKKLDVVYRISFSTLLWKTRRTTSFEQIFSLLLHYNLRKEPSSDDDDNNCCAQLLSAKEWLPRASSNIHTYKMKNIFCIMAVKNNIDNSVLFCQRKISGFRSFEKIKKSFKYVFLVFIIVDR